MNTKENNESWIRIGLSAGSIAILVNTLLLKAADWMNVDTGQGGLLNFLFSLTRKCLEILGAPESWNFLPSPSTATAGFKIGFHVVVGLLMALVYTRMLEPALPMEMAPWMKGACYALILWLFNAAIILPVIGQGFAGSHFLGLGGILYFAFAHCVFLLLLAQLTPLFRDRFLTSGFREC